MNISLRRGETIGIVGESGSGKSMLVRSIMGIAPTTARVDQGSTVRFDGRDVLSRSRRAAPPVATATRQARAEDARSARSSRTR